MAEYFFDAFPAEEQENQWNGLGDALRALVDGSGCLEKHQPALFETFANLVLERAEAGNPAAMRSELDEMAQRLDRLEQENAALRRKLIWALREEES